MAEIEKKAPRASIIILNYNTAALVKKLLSSLENHPEIEIIIVDNSEDEELKTIVPEFVHYFHTGKNVGFAGGNNYGIAQAKGEWIMILNSDTIATSQNILSLINNAEKERMLVAAPKLIGADGKEQQHVGYFDTFAINPVNWLFLRPRFIRSDSPRNDNPRVVTTTRHSDLLTGAAMLIHRSVFEKVGLFDEKNFFMYFEDIDLSYRLYRAGIEVLFVPEVTITHLGGASSDQNMKQKNTNYQKGLYNYLKKNRGVGIAEINRIFGFLR